MSNEFLMRRENPLLASLLLVVALVVPAITSGCAERHYTRVNDPYYHDYHRWTPDEDGYYRRWEGETHRDHREFRDRKQDEQKEYWNWRHQHNEDRH